MAQEMRALGEEGKAEHTFGIEVPSGPVAAAERKERENRPSAALVALIVANFVPLAFVLAGKQTVGSLVMLYWAENLVVGFWTVMRVLTERSTHLVDRIGVTVFFCLHYGLFCFVHGGAVSAIFFSPETAAVRRAEVRYWFDPLWVAMKAAGLLEPWGIAQLFFLFASHGVAYALDYVNRTLQPSIWRPYPRLLLMHGFIFLVALVAGGLGAPAAAALPALIIGKTVIDAFMQRRA